jgi:LEA14-like dessication related protein
MKKYIFILLSISSISLFSCGDFQDVSFNGIENVRIISLTQHGAEAEITAKIKNPNNVSFTIYPVDLDVVLGGMNAGKAHISGRTKIKAHSEKS